MSDTAFKPSRKEEPSFYKNAPYSSRFPQQNQTNRCWAAYVQHKIAVKKFSENSREALKQKALYTTMCPHSWVRHNSSFTATSTLKVSKCVLKLAPFPWTPPCPFRLLFPRFNISCIFLSHTYADFRWLTHRSMIFHVSPTALAPSSCPSLYSSWFVCISIYSRFYYLWIVFNYHLLVMLMLLLELFFWLPLVP